MDERRQHSPRVFFAAAGWTTTLTVLEGNFLFSLLRIPRTVYKKTKHSAKCADSLLYLPFQWRKKKCRTWSVGWKKANSSSFSSPLNNKEPLMMTLFFEWHYVRIIMLCIYLRGLPLTYYWRCIENPVPSGMVICAFEWRRIKRYHQRKELLCELNRVVRLCGGGKKIDKREQGDGGIVCCSGCSPSCFHSRSVTNEAAHIGTAVCR